MTTLQELSKDESDPRIHNGQSLIESLFELSYNDDTNTVLLLSLKDIDLYLTQDFIVEIPSHLYKRGNLNPYQVYLPDNFWRQVEEFSLRSLTNTKITFNIDNVININNVDIPTSAIFQVAI